VPIGIGGHGGPPYFTKIASKFMKFHTRGFGFWVPFFALRASQGKQGSAQPSAKRRPVKSRRKLFSDKVSVASELIRHILTPEH
jgi:hypothetical protein